MMPFGPILTAVDIEAGYDNPAWLGHGYLETRQRSARIARIQAADHALLLRVNGLHWTASQLFEFVNSKHGRWYGEDALGISGAGGTPDMCATRVTASGEYLG